MPIGPFYGHVKENYGPFCPKCGDLAKHKHFSHCGFWITSVMLHSKVVLGLVIFVNKRREGAGLFAPTIMWKP